MILEAEKTFVVGQDTFLDCVSPENSYAVVFEDNQETGYVYAAETDPTLKILDALNIYNAESVVDKDRPSEMQIFWTNDGLIAALVINNYCHAIFDFARRAGYCRNGFPPSNSDWTQIEERILTDEVVDSVFK